MARTAATPARAANGRFTNRAARSKPSGATPPAPSTVNVGPRQNRKDVWDLLVLTLAIVFGLLGLFSHLFVIGSLILMGVLWGSMIADPQRRRSTKGPIVDVVTAVVDEAKAVAESASGSEPSGRPG